MKQYLMQPTHKKCVLEFEAYTKVIDGIKTIATKETGYRSGSWIIYVPETEEELRDWCRNVHDMSLEDMMEDMMEDIDGDTTILPPFDFMPNDEMSYIDVDDYDNEMLEAYDGCWTEWQVRQYANESNPSFPMMSEEELEELREEIEDREAVDDESAYLGIEEDGWETDGFYCEIHCTVTLVECDDMGYVDD